MCGIVGVLGKHEVAPIIVEALKIAFSDRRAVTADPAFFEVPVDTLTSQSYADHRRAQIDMDRPGTFASEAIEFESANTTHMTAADRDGTSRRTRSPSKAPFRVKHPLPIPS